MSSKKRGFFQRGNRWVIVYPNQNTIDGWSEISIPEGAKNVLEEHYAPRPTNVKSPRRNAVFDALKNLPNGSEIGDLVWDVIESLGGDPDDMKERKPMFGLINALVRRGFLSSEEIDGNEIIKLVKTS